MYPGIDIIYYGNQQQLEYDFQIAPGANPKDIRLAFSGARSLRVNASGDLVLSVAGGEIRQLKPVVYQEVDGARLNVPGRYVMRGEVSQFEINGYDTSAACHRSVLVYPLTSEAVTDMGHDICSVDGPVIYVTGWLFGQLPTRPRHATATSRSFHPFRRHQTCRCVCHED